MSVWIIALIILVIAVFMTMTGHGGGNFFVIALVLSGVEMHIAATTGQFILLTAATAAMLIFGKKKYVEWKLVIFVGICIGIAAFFGGLFSDYLPGKTLKLFLAIFLFFISLLMLKPVKKDVNQDLKTGWMYLNIKSNDGAIIYPLNFLILIPTILSFGFVAGMVGISGGSFIVPLLVLFCNVPMKNAVGTASSLVAISAATGLAGHVLAGHFDYHIAVPAALGGAVGGLIGGSIAVKTKPKLLKILFSLTTLLAALILTYKVYF